MTSDTTTLLGQTAVTPDGRLGPARSMARRDFLDDFDESTRDRLGLPALAERGAMT
ncbi:hypothetical protein GCM10010492_55680 [Saccharothrix mutabilis subsp. mutabilis]|uniref:Uncharacterized protein n=1 Tax=Saccharothrix mutabilis subsp. mutabilis TaxID=66855 RepID=A0ABP3E0D3_9PSEU